jgi:prefoldin beta subunit
MDLSEETKNMIVQFQNYQQQLQSLMIQKESLNLQNMEIEKALEELGKTKQTSAYKIMGQIMVSKTVEELKKELTDMKETIELRVKSLEKNEERVSSKLKELQEKLKEVIK